MFGLPTPGTTEHCLSCEPLATEGEATPGPDDWNPYDDPRTGEYGIQPDVDFLDGTGPRF